MPLSQRLSPRARQRIQAGSPTESVSVLVHVLEGVTKRQFTERVTERGATLTSWFGEELFAVVEAQLGQLSAIAETDGVTYVETAP